MRLNIETREWAFRSTFRLAYATRTHARSVIVELHENGVVGRGEASGVPYHGETAERIIADIEAVRPLVEAGLTRRELQTHMSPSGARNAIDCALWDLEAKKSGEPAWKMAGLPEPIALTTAYTLGIDEPEKMANAAVQAADFPRIKIKLGGDGDVERVAAVRQARPSAEIIIDANQAWNDEQFLRFVPVLADLGVSLIEQPMPVGQDEALRGFNSPVPLCADESCQTVESLPDLIGKYQFVNIKLDKSGGLTEALALAAAAKSHGLRLMVGCMAGSSLAMAPAFFIGQLCEIVDLDAPLLLATDIANAIKYDGASINAPSPTLWG